MRYGQGATGRHLGFHPVLDTDMVKETLLGISTWASNGHIKGADVYVRASIVAAVILLVLVAAARASFRKPGTDRRSALPLLYILILPRCMAADFDVSPGGSLYRQQSPFPPYPRFYDHSGGDLVRK